MTEREAAADRLTVAGPTILDALRMCGLPFREARRLLATVLEVSDTWLLTHDAQTLTPGQAARFFGWAERRRAGEPLAYVLGWREFYGHRFEVGPAVLIPRPDTELLVEVALAALPAPGTAGAMPRLLDLGTGSGAVAIAVALARPDVQVWATDQSLDALTVARRNGALLQANNVQWLHGSWWQALEAQPALAGTLFDVIVSNPPYIAASDPHLVQGDLRFEPIGALTDHGDGLSHLRTLVVGAPVWLQPGGSLWLEHGYDQAAAVHALFAGAPGWQPSVSHRDLAGIARVTGAGRPAG